MGNKQGRDIGGVLLGGLVGGLVGLVLGGFLFPVLTGFERRPENMFDSCFGLILALAGAAIGGVICAVGGAALGAGLATSSRGKQQPPGERDEPPRTAGHAPAPVESTETELARLKEPVAELEERKSKQGDDRITRSMTDDRVCPSCQVVLPEGRTVCPKCGRTVQPTKTGLAFIDISRKPYAGLVESFGRICAGVIVGVVFLLLLVFLLALLIRSTLTGKPF